MKAKNLTVLLLSCLISGPATADSQIDEAAWVQSYLSLQEPEIKAGPIEVLDVHSPLAVVSDCTDYTFSTPMAAPKVSDNPLSAIGTDLGLVDVIVDKIINIGSKLWKIVEGNAPVVNLNMPTAFALPAGTQCWVELENWEPPKSQLFVVSYKNFLGMNVVNFSYRVVYTAGGSYNGVGQYLANVTVHPAKVDVAWGFTFNSEVTVGTIVNLGTKVDPEAGMELGVKWQIITPFNNSTNTENYFVRGNGEINKI